MNKELQLFCVGKFLLSNEIVAGLIPEEIGKKAYGFEMIDTPHRILTTTFELATMLLYLKAVSLKNPDAAHAVFEGFAEEIGKRVSSMETLVNAALNNEHTDPAKKAALLPIAVQLSEAKLSLQEGNYEQFMAAFDKGLEAAGISPKNLDNDLKMIRQLAASMKFALTTGMEDGTNRITGVVQM